MKQMYEVQARVLWKAGEWDTSVGVPTFFLDPDVQAIVSEDHAERIAKKIVDPMDKAEKVVATAVLKEVD